MPLADEGTTAGGLPLDGRWTDGPSPLTLSIAGAPEVVWTSAGRRMALAISALAGLAHAASDGRPFLGAASVTINGVDPAARVLDVTPVDARRRLTGTATGEERWMTALELPLAFWELAAPTAATVVLQASLTPGRPGGSCALGSGRTDRTATLVGDCGRQLVIAADAGALELDATEDRAAMRMTLVASGRVRLALIAARDDADLQRTLDLARRRGFAGLRAQRIQHERLVREYGTSLTTPLPALDTAFEWAKLRADEGLRAAGQVDAANDVLAAAWRGDVGPPDLEALLAAPGTVAIASPARLLRGVLCDLWGIEHDAPGGGLVLAPRLPAGWPRMALSRLRIGGSVVDCQLQRRPGRMVLRVRCRSGSPLPLTAGLPGVDVASVGVDGIALGGSRARFELASEHEVVFDVA